MARFKWKSSGLPDSPDLDRLYDVLTPVIPIRCYPMRDMLLKDYHMFDNKFFHVKNGFAMAAFVPAREEASMTTLLYLGLIIKILL